MSKSDFFSYIARGVIAPLWAYKERTPYMRHLKQLHGMKNRNPKDIDIDLLDRLRKLLQHASTQSPFYEERFRMVGLSAGDINNLYDLQKIPLLTKDDIRANRDRIIASNFTKEQLVPRKTSGSTGVSLDYFVDDASMQWKRAVTMTYDRWAGWNIGERVGAIWGNPQSTTSWRARLRNLLLERYTYLDTLKMNEEEMLGFYKTLRKIPPAILFGHAHSLYLFARFMHQKGLSGIRPSGIISTCMVLHDFERQEIEDVFGCRVTNRYGCEEVSLIACECQDASMHLNCDSLIVEFIRDGKPVSPGEPGAIVVTDLTNFGMPFIRYKVGDVGVPSIKSSCACGCTYPIMETLEGRVADYVVTPDGNYISGISLTENFAMHLPGVKQMQIIQEQVDFLVFRIVKGELFTEQTEQAVDRIASDRFGRQMHWQIEYVDSIQSERSGKYRFCISKLPNPFS